ncbi:DUF1934 domain-containing protein [Rubeoparvulum massiliense]|uniref:DUF1934 domain-containing protein n=1 Tax=Rubeoparvulum massiliense TaxID=1631346 RepID=UPI00065DEC59|nr:DUF1934 domain-containing protein [Rubeoparvulum massiliense]
MLSIPVNVKVVTTIQQDQEKETIEEESVGKLYGEEERYFLRYSMNEGQESEVQTTLKLEPNQLTIIRQGSVTMRHSFILGEVGRSWYTTPYGRMEMTTMTTQLEYDGKAGSQASHLLQSLLITYQLWLAGQEAGQFRIAIQVLSQPSSRLM